MDRKNNPQSPQLTDSTVDRSQQCLPPQRRQTPAGHATGAAGEQDDQASDAWSGQHGLAVVEQHFMTDSRGEHVVDLLQPSKLGLEVAHTSLKAAHLRNHEGIWPANMAKQSLRHCLRSSTLSDQSGRARRNAITQQVARK